MNILYIDRAKSISSILIGEQIVFSKYLAKDNKICFFLLGKKEGFNNNKSHNHKVYKRPNTFFFRNQLSIDFFLLLSKGMFICKKEKIDIIVARKNITTAFAGLILAKLRRAKFVYIVSFPKWEILLVKLKSNNFLGFSKLYSNFYKSVVIFLSSKSDLVIIQTNQFLKNLPELNRFSNKIISLPMGFDKEWLNEVDYVHAEKFISKFNNMTPIIYFGSMDRERKLDFIIKVIYEVKNEIENILLVMIGGKEDDFIEIRKLIDEYELGSNVLFIPKLSRNILFAILKNVIFSLSPIPPTNFYKIASPTKVVESLGFGIPVIANNEIYEQNELINISGGGLTVPYDAKIFSEKIIFLLENRGLLNTMKKRAQEFILKNRNYENYSNLLQIRFNEILNEKIL